MSVIIIFLMMSYLSTTWGIIGQTGQLSFGHSAFVGLGGYTSAILYSQLGVTPWIGLLAGGVVAVLFGVVIGLPTLRLRGTYFALATLAFASILQIVAYTTMQIGPVYIGASPGIQINLVNGGDAPHVFQFQGKAGYYYVILAMLACVLLLSFILNRRRIGYYWTAIRNDEDAAESLGINVARYRIFGFLLSCFLTGAGGAFYVQYMLAIDPRRILGLGFSTEIALMGIVGGWQSVFGPVIGAAVLVPISEILRSSLSAVPQMTTVIYGLLLVLFMIFLPQGINGLIAKAAKSISAQAASRQAAAQEGELEWPETTLSSRSATSPRRFGGLVAVDSAHFDLRRGELLGLIGPNGAGKTTLFNLIAGYYTPDRGSIVYEGHNIAGMKPYDICRRGIARTFQTTKPFLECTTIENILVGALLRETSVRKAEKTAEQIADLLDLTSVALARGADLSVPNRKLLEVGRTIATGGTLLLLDEPMAGLVPTEKERVLSVLRRINGDGRSIIIVEHDMKAVMSLCSHIVLLDRGRILLEGTPQQVTEDPRAIAAYLGEDYAVAAN